MKKILIMLLFVSVPLWAQHNTKSRWYVDTQDSVTMNGLYNARNVATYGAVPYVYTSLQAITNRLAIQAAMNDAAVNSGEVYVPAGVYMVDTTHNPGNAQNQGSLFIPSNVTLRGAGPNRTIIELANGLSANTTYGTHVIENMNIGVSANGDSNIVIRDLTINANGTNNPVSNNVAQTAIALVGVKNALIDNIVVDDIYGTGTGGAAESRNIEFNCCTNSVVRNSVCIGRSYSSTGFSQDNSLNVSFFSCFAFGFNTCGFTSYNGRGIRFTDCYAYNCIGYAGFNSESEGDIVYMSCVSGGIAPDFSTVFIPAHTVLGNTHGFVCNGDSGKGPVQYIGCSASRMVDNGIEATNAKNVIVIGGSYRKSQIGYGIHSGTATNFTLSNVTLDSNYAHAIGVGASQSLDPATVTPLPFFQGNGTVLASGYGLVSDNYGAVTLQTIIPSSTMTLSSGNGWYRVLKQTPFMSGLVRIFGLNDNNIYTDLSAEISAEAYTPNAGHINIIKNLNYNLTHIDSIRIGYDTTGYGGYYAVLDVKLSNINNPTTVTVSGSESITPLTTATFNPPLLSLSCQIAGNVMGNTTGGGGYAWTNYFGGSSTFDGNTTTTGNSTVNGNSQSTTFNGSLPINLTQDTVKFYSTNARVAKYFPGTVAGDLFSATGISPDGTTSPAAGDNSFTFAKTDSCIVIRGASSNTSGLVVLLRKLK